METSTTLYRFLTGPDDASFCHRVSEALSRGWQLHGSPSLTYDAGRKQVIAGQAIIKVRAGGYAPDLDLKSE
ncbi:MAG: DUF1737 domain-containing protein [Beijerinckiaceae bacterium]|nr:DUF1737 domain-containing protein [Beijerinckiaceae bacterium]MCZ8300771.1 DUF1737 domain-containing protein [Beijerinckiaceae bacterium]